MARTIRALFFVYVETQFLDLARLGRALSRRGDFRCAFLFWNAYPSIARDIQACREDGFEVIDASAPRPPEGTLPKLRRIAQAVRFRHVLLAPLAPRLPSWVAYYTGLRRTAESIFAQASPDILVLPEDNLEYPTGMLLRVAKERGIPGIIVPFTFSNPEELAESRWHLRSYHADAPGNRLAAALHPRWVRTLRGRDLLPLPGAAVLAQEELGIAPDRPWIVNDGDSAAIAVESEYMRRKYLAQGLSPAKLVVTGAMSDDVLRAQLAERSRAKAALLDTLSLPAHKPLLLAAIPPDQYSTARPGAEFASYPDLLRAWGSALKRAGGFSVVVRLHPRTPRAAAAILEDEFGLRICDRDTASLVPLCDVYAASASATIRMAIACAIPVVNYDCYRFGYSDYAGIPGVTYAENCAQFEHHLAALANDNSRTEIAGQMRNISAEMARLDGQAATRIIALLRETVAAGRRDSPPAIAPG